MQQAPNELWTLAREWGPLWVMVGVLLWWNWRLTKDYVQMVRDVLEQRRIASDALRELTRSLDQLNDQIQRANNQGGGHD